MKLLSLLPILLSCGLSDLACAVPPQEPAPTPLAISGLAELELPPTAPWVSDIQEPFVAIHHDEEPGEVTLLFVHTTIDATVAGPRVAAGVIQTYPFLLHPDASWTAGAASPSTIPVVNPTATLGVPPWRVLAHLQQFIAASPEDRISNYGTHNAEATLAVRQTAPFSWPVVGNTDERHAWAHTQPEAASGLGLGGYALNVAHLGGEAVIQAAHKFVQSASLPPLDQDALNRLNSLLVSDLGFEIHVQAVHVLLSPLPSAEPIRLRFSQRGTMHCPSLLQVVEDEWWALKGPQRSVPHLLDDDINVYLGGLDEEMHILFQGPVSNLRAWVPTSGGPVPVLQIPVYDSQLQLLRPWIGVFPCPANALPGTVYFESLNAPGIPVVPVKAFELGAFLSPFTLLPGHI